MSGPAKGSSSPAQGSGSRREPDNSPRTPFARRYRPRNFEEVVGQEAVGRTLRGALKSGEIPAALLFAGPRGVGKTTMARILARALNCTGGRGPTADPCGECGSCVSIENGSALDVVEVDAASHNGVDDVREIRERVAHLPAGGRFKVYVLDEAHMFSTAAWNAFLKTLEEPPPHARFVFATTEPEKVPETVLSRCQRFDFRRIRSEDIVRTLRSIVERENAERKRRIEVDDAALATLARFARGGLRDAESLLEQAILAGEGKVREEDLAALLGAVPRELVREALGRAAAGDAAGTLAAYARVHDSGGDAATFLGQALEMLREAAAVAVAGPSSPSVEASDAERESLAALAAAMGLAGVLRANQALAETLRLVKATDEERPLVEAGLLRVALQGKGRTIPEVLDALAAMEARLAAGGSADPHPSGAASPEPRGSAAPPVLFGGARASLPSPAALEDPALLTLDRVRRDWPRVLEELKARAPSLAAFLPAARPAVLAEGALTLAFPPSAEFHRSQCEEESRRRALEEALTRVFGRPLRARFETGAEEEPQATATDAREPVDRLRHEEISGLRETPAVRALEKEFQVRMVRAGRRKPEAAAGAAPGGAGEESA